MRSTQAPAALSLCGITVRAEKVRLLAGILGAYLALTATGGHPSWTPLVAACAAVRAHGLAGDLAAAHLGTRGVIATDLIQWLSQAQRRLSS